MSHRNPDSSSMLYVLIFCMENFHKSARYVSPFESKHYIRVSLIQVHNLSLIWQSERKPLEYNENLSFHSNFRLKRF